MANGNDKGGKKLNGNESNVTNTTDTIIPTPTAANQHIVSPQVNTSVATEIEVLNSQIIACQEESASYNNAYISSAVVCAVLAAVGGFASDSQFLKCDLSALIYLIPIVYLWMVFNVIKYTGFQVQLGAYRHKLEKKINILLSDNDICLMEDKTNNRKFFSVSGLGVIAFILPSIWLVVYMVLPTLKDVLENKALVIIYAVEFLVCLVEAFFVLRMILKEEKNFPQKDKEKKDKEKESKKKEKTKKKIHKKGKK